MGLFNFPLVLLSTSSILTPLYATPISTEYSNHSLTPSHYAEPDDGTLESFSLPWLDDDDLAPHLYERGEIDGLPIPPVCKKLFGAALGASKASFKFIRGTVCDKYKCHVPMKPAFEKYSVDPIRNKILKEWILASLKKAGFDVSTMINVVEKYDKITDKCIRKDPSIINIQDVCKAHKDDFKRIKSCVMEQIMDLITKLPILLMKAEEGCNAALKIELVKKVLARTPTDKTSGLGTNGQFLGRDAYFQA